MLIRLLDKTGNFGFAGKRLGRIVRPMKSINDLFPKNGSHGPLPNLNVDVRMSGETREWTERSKSAASCVIRFMRALARSPALFLMIAG